MPKEDNKESVVTVTLKAGESALKFHSSTVEFWSPGLKENEVMTDDETIGAGLFVLLKQGNQLLHSMINKALEDLPNEEDDDSNNDSGDSRQDTIRDN